MKYCGECGAELFDDSKFCMKCGADQSVYLLNDEKEEEESRGGKIALIVILSVVAFLLTLVIVLLFVVFGSVSRAPKKDYSYLYSSYPSSSQQQIVSEYDASVKESQYIIEGSDRRYIAKSELYSLSQWELKVARNEIYARHGRMFKDTDLQEYFNSKNWYAGYISPSDFKEDTLNEFEKENVKVIVEYEKEMGYR